MARFLFVLHHRRELAAELAEEAIQWLANAGHQAVILDSDAQATGLNRWGVHSVDNLDIDLAVSLGGDGTMLRAVDIACGRGTPVLGVNVGHLGYLTQVEPEHLRDALHRFLLGEYHVEERMTLEVEVTAHAAGDSASATLALARCFAINDVVVEKRQSGRTVRLEAVVNGRSFLTYAVDGMIVATATGSTAYNLSARGPILSPSLKAILMTPVSPHMLFDRPMVFDPDEALDLRVIGREEASVVVDGRHVATLGAGGVVSCRQSDRPAKLVLFEGRDFRQILKTKFGLTDR